MKLLGDKRIVFALKHSKANDTR